MTVTKIRVKTASIELEYEGSEDFLKTERATLLDTSSLGHRKTGSAADSINSPNRDGARSTRSIAAVLDVKTGSDLALAAAAQLVLLRANDSFRRQELLDEMKTATG